MNDQMINILLWILLAILYPWRTNVTYKKWGLPKNWRMLVWALQILALAAGEVFHLPLGISLLLSAAAGILTVWASQYFTFGRAADGACLWVLVLSPVVVIQQPVLVSAPVLVFLMLVPLGAYWLLKNWYIPRYMHRSGDIAFISLDISLFVWNGALNRWFYGILCLLVLAALLLLEQRLWKQGKIKNSKKPLLLFDLDGTLIDSQPLVFETFRRVFAKTKPDYPLSEEELYSFFGPTLEVTFSKYFEKDQIDEVIDLYQQINQALHDKMVREMPGARETLEKLHNAGYKIGIVSNKRQIPVEMGIRQGGFGPYIDAVFAKEDQPACKPAPDGLIHAARMMGYPLDQIIYAGDNAADIQAARNMGALSIGYTIDDIQKKKLEQAQACVLVQSLSEIPKLVMEESLWIDKSIW